MAFVILILGLVGTNTWRRHLRESKQIRLRQIIHEERIRAMEHELPLPEFNDAELSDSLSFPVHPGPLTGSGLVLAITWVRIVTLGLGLTLLLGGIGSTIGISMVSDNEVRGAWPMGLIPVFIGVGLLLFYQLSRRFATIEEGHGANG